MTMLAWTNIGWRKSLTAIALSLVGLLVAVRDALCVERGSAVRIVPAPEQT